MRIVSHVGTGYGIIRDFVESAGHEIIFVSNYKEACTIDFDRLILLGGVDVNPFLYGELIIDAQRPNVDRDKIEWALVRRAMANNVPTMGICRGCQMLNVANGGTLYQDIYTHLDIDHPNGRQHKIRATAPLADRLPTRVVNSLHHQSINKVAYGFDIVATSTDGVIEAIYREGQLGVQWHPELLLEKNRKWAWLFEWWLDGLEA